LRRPATMSTPAAMHMMANMAATAEPDPVRGSDPGTVTGSVVELAVGAVLVVGIVEPCSCRVVVVKIVVVP